MSVLPPELRIDDLTFADLLKIALDDVPGASAGRWTLHGPVDPGITVLEVMAWLYEQRLFSADQTTDDIVRAGLRLLGVAPPAPTRAASTVLALEGGGPVRRVPAGSVLALVDDAAGRRFTLDRDVSVLPVGAVAVRGRAQVSGDVLELVLERSGPLVTGHDLTLLLLLDAAGQVRPQWHTDAVEVPPAAGLAWTAVGADGSEEPVTPVDGTLGLRRAGLVRLPWPAAWNRVGGGECLLRATVTDGSFTEAVRVTAVVPHAVVARHLVGARADVTDQLRVPGLPARTVHLPGTGGALDDTPGSVVLRVASTGSASEGGIGDEEWCSVSDLLAAGPSDRVFMVDRERGDLVLGDGLAGRIPRLAIGGTATVDHRLGGGASGNLGPGSRWVEESGPGRARNPVPATGGADAESVEQARQRAADELAAVTRPVTAEDAVRVARETPGVAVARARAWVGHHPAFPCATIPGATTVVVVPEADRAGAPGSWVAAPRPDRGLLAAVRDRLEARRLLGQELFVVAPVYRRVDLRLQLSGSVDPGAGQRVTDALRRHLDPLVGGSEGDGWPFGGTLRPSGLMGVAAASAGPEITVTGLEVALEDAAASGCADVPLEPADLPWLGDVEIARSAVLPSGGGLS